MSRDPFEGRKRHERWEGDGDEYVGVRERDEGQESKPQRRNMLQQRPGIHRITLSEPKPDKNTLRPCHGSQEVITSRACRGGTQSQSMVRPPGPAPAMPIPRSASLRRYFSARLSSRRYGSSSSRHRRLWSYDAEHPSASCPRDVGR